MIRVIASAFVLLAICLENPAWAKPKIAILGLEAAPGPSGAVEPATTQVARAITKELRLRAQAVDSPYSIAPNSSKELTDEKLLMSCDNEALSCMVVIGAGLAADVLLYGRVEKRGEIYRVSLKRIDVKTKTLQDGGEDLPVGSGVIGMSKRLYIKLIGESNVTGTLIVKAASQTGVLVGAGTVLIDDEPRGKLADGRVTVTGLGEGRHVLAIEAAGYRRFEETVTIHSGEPATINALLLVRTGKDAPAEESGGGAGPWKVTLGASIAVAVAGAAFSGYSAYQVYREKAQIGPLPETPEVKPQPLDDSDCDLNEEQIKVKRQGVGTTPEIFQRACAWTPRLNIGLAVTGVGLVGVAVSWLMLSRSSEPREPPKTSARKRTPSVAVTPIVTPSLAGASLSVAW